MRPLWPMEWPKDSTKRTAYVDSIFRRVAPQYDNLTQLLSIGQDSRWKMELVGNLLPGAKSARILDLATGTAAFPILLRKAGHEGSIIGIDRSRAMLARAREKCAALTDIEFAQGDLNALPVGTGEFDAVVVGYGLRYLNDIHVALAVIHDVLRPGGVFISLDFGLPRRGWYRRLCYTYLFTLGTLWGLLLHGKVDTYWHIVESLRAYPGQGVLAKALVEAGFVRVLVAERMGGISVLARAERRADPKPCYPRLKSG